MFNYRDFGLEKGNLYEILATSFSKSIKKDSINPNTACMGIRFIEDNIFKISPYPETTTLKNLKENSYIVINFVNDVYLYALAALKEAKSLIGIKKFPPKYYEYYEIPKYENGLIPYINKAWLFLFGKVVEETQIIKKTSLGEIKISEFAINIIDFKKLEDSFKFFNRAENLALEIIILATRLKIAKEKNERTLFNEIYIKLIDHIENIKRFGKNKSALKTVDLVSNYIKTLKNYSLS